MLRRQTHAVSGANNAFYRLVAQRGQIIRWVFPQVAYIRLWNQVENILGRCHVRLGPKFTPERVVVQARMLGRQPNDALTEVDFRLSVSHEFLAVSTLNHD